MPYLVDTSSHDSSLYLFWWPGLVGYTMQDIRYKWNSGSKSVGISKEVELPQFRVLGHRQRATVINLSTGKHICTTSTYIFCVRFSSFITITHFFILRCVYTVWTTYRLPPIFAYIHLVLTFLTLPNLIKTKKSSSKRSFYSLVYMNTSSEFWRMKS